MAGQDKTTLAEAQRERRPYVGSCHCGFTRYVCWLTLPAIPPYPERVNPDDKLTQMIRKCNCTTCHKTSFFHLRVDDAPRDFALLSPLNPMKELSNYSIKPGGAQWLFCPTCGVRCILLHGPENIGQVVEYDLAAKGVDLKLAKIEGDGAAVKVWVPNPDIWHEEKTCALRVNAFSLEARQVGLDLREWTEKNWIEYTAILDNDVNSRSYEKPFEGGTY
jgi:hypothetical protein